MSDLVFGIAVVIIAYLVGAIPPAHILARRTGRDISAMGTGNVGALNALRSLGKRAAAICSANNLLPQNLAIRLTAEARRCFGLRRL